ncbi:MAG TPA: hypothetical protein VG712_00465, partial [Gemmatimonadales bacterium]|nr:hypothetical protein [Gemmatimonadales bacterium]
MGEQVAAEETGELLAIFAADARQRRGRPLALIGGSVAAAFALVSLVVVGTHDRSPDAGGGVSVLGESPGPGPAAAAPSVPTDQVAAVLGPLAPALGLSPADVATFGSSDPAGSPSGESGAGVITAPPEPDVAVVTPVLKVFAFGSKVGMPLLCNVAFSAVFAQIPDPGLAQVATAVVTACVDGSTQGSVALQELNRQLGALEAINPSV